MSNLIKFKHQANKNIQGMLENMEHTEPLMGRAQNMKHYARENQALAGEIEKEVKKRHFWAWSKKCVGISAIVLLIVVIIVIVLYFVFKK